MRTSSLALVFLAGCGLPDGNATPTWAEDVKPILMANCARCHGYPAIGGAPDSFRLDTFDDVVTGDGRVIRGAGTMAQYIALRVDREGLEGTGIETMPPQDATNQGLTDRQVDILQRWFLTIEGSGTRPERGGPPPGNQAPTFELRLPLQDSLVDGRLMINYEIRDADHDAVIGELRAGPSFEGGVRIGALHTGRGQLAWDVSAMPEGSYPLIARLDDGGEKHDLEVGSYDIAHADDNHAPELMVVRPAPYDIIAAIDGIDLPYSIELTVGDLDTADTLTATIEAVREGRREPVADRVTVTTGSNAIPWPTVTSVPEGGGWRLEVSVTDGTATRRLTTLPFRVSRDATDYRYEDAEGTPIEAGAILQAKCGGCHSDMPFVPGLDHNFFSYDDEVGLRGVSSLRGLIYRRAIEQGNMPPPSARGLGNELLTQDEKDILEDWLLGGAPR